MKYSQSLCKIATLYYASILCSLKSDTKYKYLIITIYISDDMHLTPSLSIATQIKNGHVDLAES